MVKIKKQKIHPHRKKRQYLPNTRGSFRIIFKCVLWFLLVALIGTGLVTLKYLFVDSGYFDVRSVDVRFIEGNILLRPIVLNDVNDKDIIGANVFQVDLKDLKRTVEAAHPEFRDIVVRRVLPNRLIVYAKRRKPVAQIYSDRPCFIDRDGVFLPDTKNLKDENVPLISGIKLSTSRLSGQKLNLSQEGRINKALFLIDAVIQNKRLLKYKLKTVDIADAGNISFFFDMANVEIKIGDSDFNKRLDALATVLEQLGQDIARVKYIDLRFEDPIVGPR